MLDDLQFALEQLSGSPDDGLSATERLSRALLPPNWWPLTIGERSRALLLVQSAPICLVWVPCAAVVRKLIAVTGKPARDAALVACGPTVIEDLQTLRRDCGHPRIEEQVDALREAIEARSAGFPRAAQALCASIISAVLSEHYGFAKFRDARRELRQEVPGTAALRVARRASVQSVLLASIALTWSNPPPQGFNRHLTAHAVDREQYAEAHVLEALLLVGGLLRELQGIYATGHGAVPLPSFGWVPAQSVSRGERAMVDHSAVPRRGASAGPNLA